MTNPRYHFILGLILAIVSAVCLIVAQKIFSPPAAVSYSSGIEEFKVSGVPAFSLPEFKNGSLAQSYALTNSKSKISIINFWASWCAPCVEEYSSLVSLANKFTYPGDLEVIAISVDQDLKGLNNFLLKNNKPKFSNFKILVDNQSKVAEKFGTKKIPETYIIDVNSKLLMKVIDKQNWLSRDFLAYLESKMK